MTSEESLEVVTSEAVSLEVVTSEAVEVVATATTPRRPKRLAAH